MRYRYELSSIGLLVIISLYSSYMLFGQSTGVGIGGSSQNVSAIPNTFTYSTNTQSTAAKTLNAVYTNNSQKMFLSITYANSSAATHVSIWRTNPSNLAQTNWIGYLDRGVANTTNTISGMISGGDFYSFSNFNAAQPPTILQDYWLEIR